MLQKVLSAELTLWLLSISFIVSFSLAKVGRSLGFSSQHFSIIWYLINKNYYQQQEERRFVTTTESVKRLHGIHDSTEVLFVRNLPLGSILN
jgi:hypothetical protein